MPWDSINKIITQDTAIGIGDVQRALSSGYTDLWTLCSHKSINKWAKYKPVQDNGKKPDYSGLKFIDWKNDKSSGKADSYAKCPNYNPEWWKGYKGNCGLAVKKYSSFATMIANWGECWAYEPIRLGSDAARLTDFNGYYPDAVCPFSVISEDGYMFGSEYLNPPKATMIYSGSLSSYNLNLSDISYNPMTSNGTGVVSLEDMYFGLLIPYNSSGTLVYYIVSSKTKIKEMTYGTLVIGGEGQKYAFFLYSAQGYTSILKTGENMVYPVFCAEIHSDHASSASTGELIIPMPCEPLNIKVENMTVAINTKVEHVTPQGAVITTITLQKNMNAFYDGFVRKFTVTNSGSVSLSCSVVVRTKLRYELAEGYDEIVYADYNVPASELGIIGAGDQKPYTCQKIMLSDLYRNGYYPSYVETECIFIATAGDNLKQVSGFATTRFVFTNN